MIKKIIKITLVISFVFSLVVSAQALTKPSGDVNPDDLSYVFYLYNDKGQLFADRDYEIKFDILSEKYVPVSPGPGFYKGEVITHKSETAQTFYFDPKSGDTNFAAGKIQVKGPYVSDGRQVTFYNADGVSMVNVFVMQGSICNDDGICTEAEGENNNTCPNDCKRARVTPTELPPVTLDEGYDLTTLLTYSVGGVAVLVLVWFGWRWWRKKREESFLPPPTPPAGEAPSDISALFPPPPPPPQ